MSRFIKENTANFTMKGLICPNCSTEMNFATFFKALTPWHLKCNKCKSKLRIKKYRRAAIIAVMIFGMILGIFAGIIGAVILIQYPDSFNLFVLLGLVVISIGAFSAEVTYYLLAKKLDFGLEIR